MKTVREIQAALFDRVNPAVHFSVKRYVLAIGFFLAVVAFGLLSTLGLGVDLMPSVNIPVVVVNTSYPGATPGVMDEQVTKVIENAISTISGITDINASSSTGNSRVQINFDISTDKNAASNQVAARVSAVTRRLPSGVNSPSVQTFDPNSQPILQFAIAPDGPTLEDVGTWVNNDLVPQLQRLPGVANVSVDGAPTRQFQVLLDPNRLQYFKLNPQQVSSAIVSASINQPIGTITTNRNSLSLATRNLPENTLQVASIPVDAARGIDVGDLASVRDTAVPTSFSRVNGKPSVVVSVQKSSDGNSVAVVQGVRAFMDKYNLPKNYNLIYSNDTTMPIQASIQSTYKELFLTSLVVALIVLLFLGKLNTAFSVILAIPIALSAAPVLYNLMGFTFNLVSLLALIIAIGIVVDDSIVVSENVERYRAMGYNLKDSVLKGASEVFSAVVAASLSLLSVLLPMSFLGGPIGRYIMQFSLGLAAAVGFSLVEAILFLTVRLAYTPESKVFDWRDFFISFTEFSSAVIWGFKSWKKGLFVILGLGAIGALIWLKLYIWLPSILAYPLVLGIIYYFGKILITFTQSLTMTLHGFTEAGMTWIRDHYVHGLKWVLNHGVIILIAVGIFFGATLFFIGPKIPFNFIPQSDGGTLQVNLRMPNGTPAIFTNEVAGRIEKWLSSQSEVLTIQSSIGSGGSTGLAGNAQMVLQLVPIEQRKPAAILAQDYRKALQAVTKDLPTARISVGTGGFGGGFGGGSSVSMVLSSSDLNALGATNQQVIDYLQGNQWVNDVNSSLSNTALENDFVPDYNALKGTGITPGTLAQTLQTYTSGTQAASVQIGGVSYPIQVQINPTFIFASRSVLDLPIYSPTLQTSIKAGQLGQFSLTPSPVNLSRSNRLYSVSLDINLKPGAPPALAFQTSVAEEMAKQGILGGKVTLGAESRMGASALTAQLMEQLPFAFLLALFMAYLVMGAQFNSWRYPIYLLLPVPLALIGALWFVFILGGGMDIFGVMGMLMLIGLSAKNAILYLDFVVERLDKMPFLQALLESAKLRFRPIIMTTLTILVISFPLIFAGGQGSEFGQKMGIVMLGGIVSSAVLTFFVVPAAFYLFERKRHPDSAIRDPLESAETV